MTAANRDKFSYIAGQYNQLVKFYNVEEICAEEIAAIKKAFPNIDKTRFSLAMCYLFFIPQILPPDVEKAIYLDADTLVNLDISELYNFDTTDKVLGAVTVFSVRGYCRNALCDDNLVKLEDYFNTGTVLMNLKLFRDEKESLAQGIKFIAESERYGRLFDQDVLNYCFAAKALKLPAKFNKYLPNKERALPIRPQIYHYAAHALNLDVTLNYNRLWMSYFIKTPWFDENAIGRLYEGFLKIRNDLKASAANISAIVSGKTRAFFVEPAKIDAMKKFFSIRDDEIIIPAENENSLTNLIDAMKNSKDKCVFFIMTQKFLKKDFPFDRLTKEGFVEKKDFVKGWGYLSAENGNPLNSYPLIQAM